MAEFITEVSKENNTFKIYIPKYFSDEAKLKKGKRVKVTIEGV